jgi:hypothetical protein
MKKLLPLALLAAAAIVVPAQASRPTDPGSQGAHHSSQRCKHSTLTKSYVFGGTLTTNPTLTQTAGANTAGDTSDDLFTIGDLTFTVTNANHYAKKDHPAGSTYTDTVENVAVNFGQNADTTQRTPQAGDHVTIHARQTFKTKRNCQANLSAEVGGTKIKSVGFGGQPTPTP